MNNTSHKNDVTWREVETFLANFKKISWVPNFNELCSYVFCQLLELGSIENIVCRCKNICIEL